MNRDPRQDVRNYCTAKDCRRRGCQPGNRLIDKLGARAPKEES